MLLVHFLADRFKLYYYHSINLSDVLLFNEKEFHIDLNSRKSDGFIGFFDWLRGSKSEIIGIRACFFEHQEYNDILTGFPYTFAEYNGKCVGILFADGKYNANISDDQDFSNNYVYQSTDGELLITFKLDRLERVEMESILKHCKIIA